VPRQCARLHVLRLVRQHVPRVQELEPRVLRLCRGHARAAQAQRKRRCGEQDSPGVVPVCACGLPGCRLPGQLAGLHMLGVVQQHTCRIQGLEPRVLRLQRCCAEAA